MRVERQKTCQPRYDPRHVPHVALQHVAVFGRLQHFFRYVGAGHFAVVGIMVEGIENSDIAVGRDGQNHRHFFCVERMGKGERTAEQKDGGKDESFHGGVGLMRISNY